MKKSAYIVPLLTVVAIIAGVLVYVTTAPDKTPGKTRQPPSSVQSRLEVSKKKEPVSTDELYSDSSNVLLSDGTVADGDLIIINQRNKQPLVKTISPVYCMTPDATVMIPDFYQEVEIPSLNYPVYAFTDTEGTVQIRVYGTRWYMENNIRRESLTGFYKQELVKTKTGVAVKDTGEHDPADDKKEKLSLPKRKLPDDGGILPDGYIPVTDNLYVCHDVTEKTGYRTWAEVNGIILLYPCSAKGEIARGAIPVDYTEEGHMLSMDDADGSSSDEITRYPGIIDKTIILTVK